MSSVRELREIIPFIQFNQSHSINPLAEDNPDEKDDWVMENVEIGLQGEQYVRQFFVDNYDASVTKMHDSCGYDFRVEYEDNTFAVEVKTSRNNNHFFISHNEMSTAKVMREKYYIFLVSGFNGATGRLFKIQDPYQKLNFERFLGSISDEGIAEIFVASIKINLKDLVACGFEEITGE